ncbi:hypothetical protein D9M71_736110 [compost metagenome]
MGSAHEFFHWNAKNQVLRWHLRLPAFFGHNVIIPEKLEDIRLTGLRIGDRPHGYHYG